MSEPTYNKGGYIKGGDGTTNGVQWTMHPDECLFLAEDVRAGRFRCGRSDHPTAGSTCGIAAPPPDADA